MQKFFLLFCVQPQSLTLNYQSFFENQKSAAQDVLQRQQHASAENQFLSAQQKVFFPAPENRHQSQTDAYPRIS